MRESEQSTENNMDKNNYTTNEQNEQKQLLEIMTWLTKKYTSNESSSVTYETANMLMEAILYCIDENDHNSSTDNSSTDNTIHSIVTSDSVTNLRETYDNGYQLILRKVKNTKDIYDKISANFHDYHCKNYHDTILEGFPAFFLRYDARFQPQNHLLTLDYPIACPDSLDIHPNHTLCGIDLLSPYLRAIQIEADFLSAFPDTSIEALLERIMPDYRTLYFDNICNCVLLTAIGCLIAENNISLLKMSPIDCEKVYTAFCIDNLQTAKLKVHTLITTLFHHIFPDYPEMLNYFLHLSNSYAVRILNAIEHDCLENLF